MSQFSSAMGPVRDTYGFDRADRSLLPMGSQHDFGRAGPVASAGSAAPPAGGAAASSGQMGMPVNPYRAQNRENAAGGDAGQYAGQSFEKWYGGLSPTDAARFAGSDPNHENAAGIQKTNARQHYMTNVLPQDPQYQQLQGTQRTARDARIAGSGVEDFQRDQADATGARNTADAIKTDAASRSTLAQGQAGELSGRGELERAQGTVLLPAQARSLDAGTGAVTNDTRIKGEQWQAQKPLYPGQLQAQTDLTRADAGLKTAQAGATTAQGTSNLVTAYSGANRPTITKDDAGDVVATPPESTYGLPQPGSMLPTITPRPTAPTNASAMTPGTPSANALNTPAAPSPAAAPSLWQRLKSGAAAAVAPKSLLAPESLILPQLGLLRQGKNFVQGFNNAGAPPAPAPANGAKTLTVNGVSLTQRPDGAYSGSNGRVYKIGPDGKFAIAG